MESRRTFIQLRWIASVLPELQPCRAPQSPLLRAGIHESRLFHLCTCPIRILTATAFWLCLAIHCGRVAECHLPHAAMSAGCHFPLPRPPTEEGLLPATPQLPFPASTSQALSVSELRKRLSCARTSEMVWELMDKQTS